MGGESDGLGGVLGEEMPPAVDQVSSPSHRGPVSGRGSPLCDGVEPMRHGSDSNTTTSRIARALCKIQEELCVFTPG